MDSYVIEEGYCGCCNYKTNRLYVLSYFCSGQINGSVQKEQLCPTCLVRKGYRFCECGDSLIEYYVEDKKEHKGRILHKGI